MSRASSGDAEQSLEPLGSQIRSLEMLVIPPYERLDGAGSGHLAQEAGIRR